ncbi:MAG: hypothetical protein JWM68_3221 [Verrucomicrobiales bacterium]|nr:hypothetical protein [Verrucomicrobiales bacterium]
MKKVFLRTALLLAVGIGLLSNWLYHDPKAPHYETIKGGVKVSPGSQIFTDGRQLDPFAYGKMSLLVCETNETQKHLLFDIDERQVLGEFSGAQPLFATANGTKFFCSATSSESAGSFRLRLFDMVWRITGGKINLSGPQNTVEQFWSVDLKTHSAKAIGHVMQSNGARTGANPSPHHQFAYTVPTLNMKTNEIILFDLERNTLETRVVPGDPFGWWDDTNIFVQTPQNELMLYDVNTRSNSFLLSFSYLAEFFEEHGLTNAPQDAQPFLQWDGTNTVLYLTEGKKRWLAEESYLIRMERPEPTLTLVSKRFEFELDDHFDPTGTRYLYPESTTNENSTAVVMRDLTTGATHTLESSTSEKAFVMPQFYKDSVIYRRNNGVWQINLTTSNTTRLFPPEDTGAH